MNLFKKLVMPVGEKPKSGWVKWRHSGIPDEEGEDREDARDDAEENRHCKVCTVLSGDYFPSFNMPLYPQHPHCDCMLFSISKPTSQAVASCALEKFVGYIFRQDKSKGKTELFESWGYTIDDSENLKSKYEKQAKQKYMSGDYSLQLLDVHGQRLTIAIELKQKIEMLK